MRSTVLHLVAMQTPRIAQRQLAAKSSPDHDPHARIGNSLTLESPDCSRDVTHVDEVAHRIHSAVMVLQFVDSIAPHIFRLHAAVRLRQLDQAASVVAVVKGTKGVVASHDRCGNGRRMCSRLCCTSTRHLRRCLHKIGFIRPQIPSVKLEVRQLTPQ